MILNRLGLSEWERVALIQRCFMKLIPALALFACLSATTASADTRVFIIPNQSDGYGIDQCLANGDKCGSSAARSYCQSRDFSSAVSYRRIDPDEITGAIPSSVSGDCPRGGCNDFLAITCQR